MSFYAPGRGPPSNPTPTDLDHIIDGIYIGSHYVLKTATTLNERGIKTVINCAIEFITENPELINWDELRRNNIEVHNTMWDDTLTQTIFPTASLETAVRKLDECVRAGKPVLVNCAMGRSRSTSLVVAYLMARKGMQFEEAVATCKRGRSQCNPNQNFERQLRALQASLQAGRLSSPPATPSSPLSSSGNFGSGFPSSPPTPTSRPAPASPYQNSPYQANTPAPSSPRHNAASPYRNAYQNQYQPSSPVTPTSTNSGYQPNNDYSPYKSANPPTVPAVPNYNNPLHRTNSYSQGSFNQQQNGQGMNRSGGYGLGGNGYGNNWNNHSSLKNHYPGVSGNRGMQDYVSPLHRRLSL